MLRRRSAFRTVQNENDAYEVLACAHLGVKPRCVMPITEEAVRAAEEARDLPARLAQMEDSKSLPWGLVWQEYCARHERPSDGGWLAKVQADEKARLSARR